MNELFEKYPDMFINKDYLIWIKNQDYNNEPTRL